MAQLTVSNFSAATSNSITAVHGGDTNFTGSNGAAAISVTVAALDYTFSASTTASQTVNPGSAASYTFR